MKIFIRMSVIIALSLTIVALALEIITKPSEPSQFAHSGLLVFTDLPKPEYGISIELFDLEQNKRSSLRLERFEDIGILAYVDEQQVYVGACFASNDPMFCSAYVREIVSPDVLSKFDVVKRLWQKDFGAPVWSPDGTRVAFSMFRDRSDDAWYHGDTFVMDADGTNMLDLTPDEDNNGFTFSWSPDSLQIAFACSDEQQLCIGNADGSNLQRIDIPENTMLRDLSWSPNGNQIVFSLLSRDYKISELYTVNSDGSHMSRLLEAGSNHHELPVWSPDGSKIAFRSGEQNNNIGEIYVIEPDGTNLHNLSQSLDGSEFGVTWSPDGTGVAFFSYQYEQGMFLYTANSDGTGLQQITDNSTWDVIDAGSPVVFWLP